MFYQKYFIKKNSKNVLILPPTPQNKGRLTPNWISQKIENSKGECRFSMYSISPSSAICLTEKQTHTHRKQAKYTKTTENIIQEELLLGSFKLNLF